MIPTPAASYRLGSLSQRYESAKEGAGSVSKGGNDPGGQSYGTYQLSSNAGTLVAFLKAEGKPWAPRFGASKGGSAAFSECWREIAAQEEVAFGEAQHAFIERTHYRTTVAAVLAAKGLDIDLRHNAVRDATWSIAVQHAKAATILIDAINACDRECERGEDRYDRELLEAMYQRRIDYVRSVAANPKLPAGQHDQLLSITRNRYPAELADALKLLDAAVAAEPTPTPVPKPTPTPTPAPAAIPPGGANEVDGNVIAAANGVLVKSAAVKLKRLHPKMEAVIVAVAKVAKAMNLPTPVITSGNDSMHMTGSLHYSWRALDFRGNNIPVAVGKKFAEAVVAALGKEYDVAFETFVNATNNHLHVEHDPT